MRYYLCLLIVAICGAARIPRVTEQPYFPAFQNIYANHNYQTDSVNNHAGGPFFENYRLQDGSVGNEFYDHRTSIDDRVNFDGHLTEVPFEDFRSHTGTVPQHYERFNHVLNYDYQL